MIDEAYVAPANDGWEDAVGQVQGQEHGQVPVPAPVQEPVAPQAQVQPPVQPPVPQQEADPSEDQQQILNEVLDQQGDDPEVAEALVRAILKDKNVIDDVEEFAGEHSMEEYVERGEPLLEVDMPIIEDVEEKDDDKKDEEKDGSDGESTDSDSDNDGTPPVMFGQYRSRLIVKGKESTSRPKRKLIVDDDEDYVYDPTSEEALEMEEMPIVSRKHTRVATTATTTTAATAQSAP